VRARAHIGPREGKGGGVRVDRVAFDNVPSFVFAPGLPVRAAGRDLRADVAFGGAFYAIVDAEAVGLPITPARLPELRRAGMEIKHAVEAAITVVHPEDIGLNGIYGTIFTGPPDREDADLKNVTIFADAEVDRSPCGTGTCAVMAVLDAMGLMPAGRAFGHESLIGTLFSGRITGRTRAGGYDAILPELEGSAWITGEHVFLVDDEDPLKGGFRL
jgi:trans-L-3-hydroxyproline dehydratase